MDSVIEHIEDMAKALESSARSLRKISESIKAKKDIDYAQDAMTEIANLYMALRLNVFISRILREVEK